MRKINKVTGLFLSAMMAASVCMGGFSAFAEEPAEDAAFSTQAEESYDAGETASGLSADSDELYDADEEATDDTDYIISDSSEEGDSSEDAAIEENIPDEDLSAAESDYSDLLIEDGEDETDSAAIADGTYTVTANLKVDVDDLSSSNRVKLFFMKQLLAANNITEVYPTNPDNPKGIVDENAGITVAAGFPGTPVSDNATLVAADGVYTLTIPVRNPMLTLQDVGSYTLASGMTGLTTTSVTPSNDCSSYGNVSSRINKIIITFSDIDTSLTQYTFTAAGLHGYNSDLDVDVDLTASKMTLDIDWPDFGN